VWFFQLILLILTALVSLIFSNLLTQSARLFTSDSDWMNLIYDRTSYFLIFTVLGGILYGMILPWFLPHQLKSAPPTLRQVLYGTWSDASALRSILIGISAGLLFTLLLLTVMHFFNSAENLTSTRRTHYMELMRTDAGFMAFASVVIVIITPVLEELHYRFFIQVLLLRHGIPLLLTLIFQGLLFGFSHSPSAAVFLSLLGILFGLLSYRNGLLSAITAHTVYNAGIIFLSFRNM
jgi:hypothetical protein